MSSIHLLRSLVLKGGLGWRRGLGWSARNSNKEPREGDNAWGAMTREEEQPDQRGAEAGGRGRAWPVIPADGQLPVITTGASSQ